MLSAASTLYEKPMRSQDQMIVLNRHQAEFYDSIQRAEDRESDLGYAGHEEANALTRLVATLRYQQQRAVAASGIQDRVRQMHLKWIAEMSGGRFLEIGCFSGSAYTFDLISAAGDYTGVELSSAACLSLKRKVEARNQSSKTTIVNGDFLEYKPDCKFDFIYAHGVLHHFENPEPLFARIRDLISDDGLLVFVEPVAINSVYRFVRSLYRPFQSDAAWEWPFRELTVSELTKRFELVDGFGWGRFSLPLSVVCSVPGLGSMVLPAYKWIVQNEVSTVSQSSYWRNSMVVAKCRPAGWN
jgi:SAM-dependent methyltransferase